jgi:predicted metalloprotease with PDZ domain
MVLRGPGRLKQSVAQSSWDAWTKYYQMDENTPNAVVSYYAKGSLIALGLDLLIREKTRGEHSLDTLMQHFWQMYQLSKEGLAEDDVAAAIRFLFGPQLYQDWRVFEAKYILGCEDLPLDRWLTKANPQIQITSQYSTNAHTQDAERVKQAWGIRSSAQQGWVKLSHVLDGGLAQQAGLAAGDYLASMDRERVTPARLNQILLGATQALMAGEDVQIQAYRHESLLELVLEAEGLVMEDSLPTQYCITVQ